MLPPTSSLCIITDSIITDSAPSAQTWANMKDIATSAQTWAKFEDMRQQLAQVLASSTSATAISLPTEGTRLGLPLQRAVEAAHHTPKLLPQPHDADAFGFLNWKPPPTSAALQSSCVWQQQLQLFHHIECTARLLAWGWQLAGTQLLILDSTGPERGKPPPCRTGTRATWCRRPA